VLTNYNQLFKIEKAESRIYIEEASFKVISSPQNFVMKFPAAVCIIVLMLVVCIPSQDKQHGIIWLEGLGRMIPHLCKYLRLSLGLSRSVEVVCPNFPRDAVGVFKHTWPAALGFNHAGLPSWFDVSIPSWFFNTLPGVPTSGVRDLEQSSLFVDYLIQELIKQGIPAQNIVVAGYSQGGALTLYHAVHSEYKIGGFVSLAGWYPNLLADPSVNHPAINEETPILQVHGLMDGIVLFKTAEQTAQALSGIFTEYNFQENTFETHVTVINPFTIRGVRNWLQLHNLLSFDTVESVQDTFYDLFGANNPAQNSLELSLEN